MPEKTKNKKTDAPEKKKARGRPKKEVPEIPYVEVAGGGPVKTIPLKKIDTEDKTFQFRINLRVGALAESIKENGQQFPVLLRKREDDKLQIISGFRRIAAIEKLKWDKVNVIIRDDLKNDADACKTAIIENEDRQTYNDLDRAYAILAYRKMGKSNAEIEEIFKVGSRQRERLEKLTTFPDELKKEVAKGDISSTNAVRLMQYIDKYPKTDMKKWIDWIKENKATYKQLNAALQEEAAGKKEGQPVEFYVAEEKEGKKSLRIRPISIDDKLTPEQREALVNDLQAVIKFVEGL